MTSPKRETDVGAARVGETDDRRSGRRPRRARESGRRAPRRSRRPRRRGARRRRHDEPPAQVGDLISAGSRPSAAQCSCRTATLWRTVVGVAEQVAGVGVAGDEPKRAPLARCRRRGSACAPGAGAGSTSPRATVIVRPSNARRALAPHQRQQLERVLQALVALAPAAGTPTRRARARARTTPRRGRSSARPPDSTSRVATTFAEVREVAVGDAGDERAEPDALGHAREVGERGVALEHVLPLAPDLRDLEEVVHHPQAREARLLGGRADSASAGPVVAGAPRPGEARDLQAEVERHGSSSGARRRPARSRNAGGDERRRAGGVDGGEALAREAPGGALRLASWRLTTFPGTGAPRSRLRARTTFAGVSSTTAYAGTPCFSASARQPTRRAASRPVVSTTVVSLRRIRLATIRSSTSNASLLARWSRSRAPTTPRSRSRRHDLVGAEPLRRPRRLARRRWRRRARRGTGPGAGSRGLDDVEKAVVEPPAARRGLALGRREGNEHEGPAR